MQRALALALAAAVLASCGSRAPGHDGSRDQLREPVVGLPCEGCDAVFEGLPDARSWASRIAPEGEPGDDLRIEGTVRDRTGRAVPGVLVYAYHTDARGLYPSDPSDPAAHRHGRLRGWASSDGSGRYRFDTIRPAGYPDSATPAHVHLHVLEPGRCTYYIDDVLFADDPRLTASMRAQLTSGRGGPGVATPVQSAAGSWAVTRDIVLGENIPGYPPDAGPTDKQSKPAADR
ncbi:MAG: hypothetical protein P1V81_12425 [Planctomycetota bacterium]|nr:hypothetical protein [Planctomycetota bacterium]